MGGVLRRAGFGCTRGQRRRRGRRLPAAVVTSVVALGPLVAPAAPAAPAPGGGPGGLEAVLLQAVRDAGFEGTIDFGPFEDSCPGSHFCPVPALPVRHLPNVDLAVIELDDAGRLTRAANVLVSRDHPAGVVVPLDRKGGPAGSWGASDVRWRRWDIDRYNGGTFHQQSGRQLTTKGWTDDPPRTAADDIVPGREGASLEFMAPYPASLFKLVVAFRVLRLVDQGALGLDDPVSWDPTVASAAVGVEVELPPPTRRAPAHDTRTRPVRAWMDDMITHSDNDATRALLKLLWDRNDLPAMHAELRDLGLGTLQINGTDPATGRRWAPGQIHMTSMDTARLLWLVEGGPGTLWTRPDGLPVTASLLSDGSRQFFKGLLHDQAWHEALSTGALCGAPNVNPGIPALVPARWIGPGGAVTVGGYSYGQDVRPCNATAEVTFAHKTGLTFNYGSDAGIVRSLPGKPGRHYVISFIASLGYRYTDPVNASRSTYPCYDTTGAICYTQRIPALARQIDRALAGR